jgi:hypothetical protein
MICSKKVIEISDLKNNAIDQFWQILKNEKSLFYFKNGSITTCQIPLLIIL